MDVYDGLLFFRRAADQEFDFGSAFLEIDSDDDGREPFLRYSSPPNIDPRSIIGKGTSQIPIVKRICKVGIAGVQAATWTVNDDLAGCDEFIKGVPERY